MRMSLYLGRKDVKCPIVFVCLWQQYLLPCCNYIRTSVHEKSHIQNNKRQCVNWNRFMNCTTCKSLPTSVHVTSTLYDHYVCTFIMSKFNLNL